MKKIYTLLLLISCITTIHAQNNCSTPYSISSTGSYIYNFETGMPSSDTTNHYGCLTNWDNQTWFDLKICTPGTINIAVNTMFGSAGDASFVVWGPFTSATQCGLTAAQIVYCSTGNITSVDSIHITGVSAGDYYKFVVVNPSDTVGTYVFYTTPTNTATFDSICYPCATAAPTQEICKVTTDPVTNHNIIIWNKDTTYHGAYLVQKESTTMGVYTTIATIANNDTSAYADMVSNPMIQSFIYRIETDTCGHTTVGSPHETIHLLTSTSSSTGYPQLSWNAYSGFSYGTYFIYRGASPATLSLYDSISASFNSYTDVNAVSGLSYYAIVVSPPTPCQPSRSMDECFSNTAPVIFTGIAENVLAGLTLSPNPATDALNFNTGTDHYNSITFEIYDVTGRKLYGKLYENTSQAKIDISSLANGYYVVRLITEKGTAQRNIIISR